MATHPSILAWKILWTEEPGGLQYMGLQRVWHHWVTNTYLLPFLLIKILGKQDGCCLSWAWKVFLLLSHHYVISFSEELIISISSKGVFDGYRACTLCLWDSSRLTSKKGMEVYAMRKTPTLVCLCLQEFIFWCKTHCLQGTIWTVANSCDKRQGGNKETNFIRETLTGNTIICMQV